MQPKKPSCAIAIIGGRKYAQNNSPAAKTGVSFEKDHFHASFLFLTGMSISHDGALQGAHRTRSILDETIFLCVKPMMWRKCPSKQTIIRKFSDGIPSFLPACKGYVLA